MVMTNAEKQESMRARRAARGFKRFHLEHWIASETPVKDVKMLQSRIKLWLDNYQTGEENGK